MLYSVAGFFVLATVAAIFGFTEIAAGAAGLVFLLLLAGAIFAVVLGAMDRSDHRPMTRLKDG